VTRRLPAAFALSGAAAAAFEILWFHQAGLALGNSVVASSLVLGGFMAGLALGSGIALRLGDDVRWPVRAFVALEAAVAVSGIGLVHGLPALTSTLAPVLAPLADTPALVGSLRFGLAFALLVVPTTAMGLTLPLLVRALTGPGLAYGPSLGRLYGWNTLGAVAGVLGAEILAIEALGIRGTALAAGAANLAAAALVWSNRRDEAEPAGPAIAAAAPSPGPRLAAAAAAFLAGSALLALEVVGFRFLSLFVVTRAEAFAWMLASVLAGIGLGSVAAERVLRRGAAAARHAPALAFAVGACIALAYATFPWLTAAGTHKLDRALEVVSLSVPLLLPAALASGALFPWIGAMLRAEFGAPARTTGALALANTIGAACGAIAGAFLWLPWLGMERSFFGLASLSGVAGLLLLPLAGATWATRFAAGVWLLALLAFPFGALESRHLEQALSVYELPADANVELREGTDQTLVWIETSFLGEPYTHRLVTDGYSMSATNVQARRYMKLYVVLPAALHPNLRRGLLVSYGVGSTARALADIPSFEAIDVVDISREILGLAARAFPDAARNPLADSRVSVHVEDGRYFLASTDARYDLITGEPPPPMLAGVVNLYTREYFALVRSRLAPGGYFTTWLPLRQLSDAGALSIVAAFCEAFPDCSLWRGQSFELMLLGSHGAAEAPSEAHFTAQWHDPAARPELEAIGLERPEQLGALFIADSEQLREFLTEARPLSDDRPRRLTAAVTSIDAQHALYAAWLDPRAGRARFSRSAFVEQRWPPTQRRAALGLFELTHLLDTFGQDIRSDRWSERFSDLRAVLGSGLARAPVLWLLGSDADAQAILARATPDAREQPEALWHRAVGLVAERQLASALPLLGRAAEDPQVFERATALELFLRCALGQRELAGTRARATLDQLPPGPRRDDLVAFLAEACGLAAR
jgi:predicted membrane-bound spermidine synthase